jgi:hypothetical protein
VKALEVKSKRVGFGIFAPQAENVHLCGSFNHWSESSDPMKKDSAGTWKKTKMPTEGVYEYKFLVDVECSLDPECPDATSNGFGTENNILATLLEYGLAAKISCEAHAVTPALEHIVEANTLLSGLGFDNETIHNEPIPVEPMPVLSALKAADAEGRRRKMAVVKDR